MHALGRRLEGYARLQGEGHGDVHPGGPVQMGEEVGEEGIALGPSGSWPARWATVDT